MLEAQRVEHIERLIQGIEIIGPGSYFERFGAKFLDHHLNADLVHRGLNAQLNPVGSTVDSVDDSGRLAAEYSIEKNYFQGKWVKPTDDLLHVLRTHTAIEDIYLLSSQTSTPADIETARARVQEWPGFHHRTIHYYDARRIAEVIVDEMLLDDLAVSALEEHLPVLIRVLNEHQATLTVPPLDPHHVILPQVNLSLDAALNAHGVAVLSGIAGSGKSDAAAAYVNSRRAHYQTTIWIQGAELSNVNDLKSTRLWRGGAAINLSGMLRTKRCLLVIDDLQPAVSPASLMPLCEQGSHILITRRESEPGDLSIPDFSAPEARKILDRDLETPCPETILHALMNVVGGHPLSLALINKAVVSGIPWEDIDDDCENMAQLVDGRQRLADKILGHLKPLLADELAIFDWSGQSSCDHRFLKSVIRTTGMMKLGGQGLKAADRPAVTRIHDIVYASLKVQGWLSHERAAYFDTQFDNHLRVIIEEESLALRVLASTMRGKLESLVKTTSSSAAMTALLSIWRPEDYCADILKDPASCLLELAARGTPLSYVDVRLILETIEYLYRLDKTTSLDTAKTNLAARLPLFHQLLSLDFENRKSVAETRHHYGKALKVLGQEDKAIEEFEAVIASDLSLDAARLQLIRLYAGKNPRAVDLADEILTAAREPLKVISSVVLGVVENLSWAKGEKLHVLFDKHAALIEQEILVAAESGLDQAYTALASVGRYWSWHEPSRLEKIFTALPVPAVADSKTCAALGEILLKLAKSSYPPKRERQEQAVQYYRSIVAPDDFQLQKYGEVLIDLGHYPEAESVLRRISNTESNAFACYRLSQARLGQNDTTEALSLINTAIGLLDDAKKKFAATFFVQRFKVRQARAEINAPEDLDLAIAACEPGKYREYLKGLRATL